VSTAESYELVAVAYLTQPWSRPVADLEALRAAIATAPAGVLFHHAVQFPLRHPAADELPPDDFTAWVQNIVQDPATAERLSYAVQSHNGSADALRAALLDVLGALPDASRAGRRAPEGGELVLLSSTPVEFAERTLAPDAASVVASLVEDDAGVWFHHLTAEPWFTGRRATLLVWLETFAQDVLAAWLDELARSGQPIDVARRQLAQRWRRRSLPRRLAAASGEADVERREAGRRAVARLLRRATAPEPDA